MKTESTLGRAAVIVGLLLCAACVESAPREVNNTSPNDIRPNDAAGAGTDAGPEAGPDAGTDTGSNTLADASTDASTDAGVPLVDMGGSALQGAIVRWGDDPVRTSLAGSNQVQQIVCPEHQFVGRVNLGQVQTRRADADTPQLHLTSIGILCGGLVGRDDRLVFDPDQPLLSLADLEAPIGVIDVRTQQECPLDKLIVGLEVRHFVSDTQPRETAIQCAPPQYVSGSEVPMGASTSEAFFVAGDCNEVATINQVPCINTPLVCPDGYAMAGVAVQSDTSRFTDIGVLCQRLAVVFPD